VNEFKYNCLIPFAVKIICSLFTISGIYRQMHELDDIALLRQYSEQNSEEAFATLVTRHIDRVYSVALRHTGNPHHAEEITQAVFVILARKSNRLSKRVILEGWLYQTARLTAMTFIRSEIRRARREQESYMQTSLNEKDSETWTQIAPLLDTALAGLNETDRHAVVLRFFYGKSLREIGTAMGGSEDTARMRINRAAEKLQKFFLKRGIASTTATLAGTISANSVQAAPVALAKTVTAVAIAKGAAASGSTLTLIKGALKIMAWTKLKTAIVAGAIVLFAVGTVIIAQKHSSGTEFRGTLKLVFPIGSQTNNYDFRLLSKPPYWELSLTSSNRNHHVYGSPQQTFEVDIYDSPPTGPLNTASIKIFPGARPLSDREAEHAWLALLSQKAFIGQKLPLQDPGLGMAEPSTISNASGAMDDVSPRQMQWVNEFPDGRTTRIEGKFKWLASTNNDGLNVPTDSEMSIYLVDSIGNRKLASFSELVVDSIAPSGEIPIQIPKIQGRNAVYDFRSNDFSKVGWFPKSRQYDIFDGKDLEKMPPSIPETASHSTTMQYNLKLEQPSSHKWIWISVILIVSIVTVIIGLIKRK
jgi:RNA polymerase sigma factor (sigma-70 family)